MKRHIFLIGFMGAGKTVVSQALSARTGIPSADTDEMIRREQGMEITDIFAQKGEAHFRTLETDLLRSLKGRDPMIISCGGGMPLREENASLMKEAGTVIWLTARPETIYERLKDDQTRPLLKGRNNPQAIGELMESRRERYEAAGDIQIAVDGRSVEEICEEIMLRI